MGYLLVPVAFSPIGMELTRRGKFYRTEVVIVGNYRRSFRLAVAIILGAAATGSALVPIGETVDFGNGHHRSEWFGDFNASHFPWIYHYGHGWMYCLGDSEDSIWLWSPQLGWTWTSCETYPLLYQQNRDWIYCAEGFDDPHWYYDYCISDWVCEEQVPRTESYYPVPGPLEFFYWMYEVNGGKPVTGTSGDLTLGITYTKYMGEFSGNDLMMTFDSQMTFTGTYENSGEVNPVDGTISSLLEKQHLADALGAYVLANDTEYEMVINYLGSVITRTEFSNEIFRRPLVHALLRNDLWNVPVETVYNQWVTGNWIHRTSQIEVDGDPVDSSTFDDTFSLSVRWEILNKHWFYYLGGKRYSNVVVVSLSQGFFFDSDSSTSYSSQMLWLAPGVGIIRWYESSPSSDAFDAVLISSNLNP